MVRCSSVRSRCGRPNKVGWQVHRCCIVTRLGGVGGGGVSGGTVRAAGRAGWGRGRGAPFTRLGGHVITHVTPVTADLAFIRQRRLAGSEETANVEQTFGAYRFAAIVRVVRSRPVSA